MYEDLLKPENLKLVIPIGLGAFSAFVGCISALLTTTISPFLNKRAKVSELRATRGYDLAEKIASAIQQIEDAYCYFESFWELNFSDCKGIDEGIRRFNRQDTLFQSQREGIRKLYQDVHDCKALLRGSWIYLPESVVKSVKEYLDCGNFSFLTDSIGIVNDFDGKFLENLLNPKKMQRRTRLYKTVVKRLGKLRL